MPDGLHVRAAKRGDYAALHEMYRAVHAQHRAAAPALFTDADPLPEDAFFAALDDARALWLVAERDGEAVGFCAARIQRPAKDPLLHTQRTAFLEALYVRAAFRRSGVGTALYRKLAALARLHGALAVELIVWPFNAEALRFYESLGMSPRCTVLEQALTDPEK